MGSGFYSITDRVIRSQNLGYQTKLVNEIFEQKQMNVKMNPINARLRESRDSDEHPNSLAIIIGLDVTGSMGHIPHLLVKDGLPNMMNRLFQGGIKDPQIMFMGVGDHHCDRSPLQISQFESSDELLDKWLTQTYLEGGGGGNGGESYALAWYFAAYRTDIDCLNKRNQKGFIFTIGDDAVHACYTMESLRGIMGHHSEYKSCTAVTLLHEACKKYHVYHLHLVETTTGNSQYVQNSWKSLMGENVIFVPKYNEIPDIIAHITTSILETQQVIAPPKYVIEEQSQINTPEKEEEMFL